MHTSLFIKNYDESNMKLFALSLWGKNSLGFSYFDKFIKIVAFKKMVIRVVLN